MSSDRADVTIAGHSIPAGSSRRFEVPLARLMSGTEISLPMQVFHGADDGPTVWLSGAIHGDELCGVEIIRQVAAELQPEHMRGTVITCPIVNVHGFNTGDRYLPDRRDLNRSFPGSARGSMAARIARLFLEEVVDRCGLGIDFHTGTDHRSNLPHIRADLDDPETLDLTRAFAPPIAVDSRLRDGSLRAAALDRGAKVLLFEGGEALRFERGAIRAGRDGTLRVLRHLGIVDRATDPGGDTLLAEASQWSRASRSGIVDLDVDLGDRVESRSLIGHVRNAFGDRVAPVRARASGIVIGIRRHPLVNQGDAIVHIARL